MSHSVITKNFFYGFIVNIKKLFRKIHSTNRDANNFFDFTSRITSCRNANEMAKRPESLKPQPEKHLTNLMQIMIETGHQATAPVAQCRHGRLV